MNLLLRLLVSFVGLATISSAFAAELRIGLMGLERIGEISRLLVAARL